MLRKPNLTFVTLKKKVTTPKRIGFLRGLWGSYIPGFNLIAVILFELTHENGCLTEFDLCDLCDLENQGQDPKIKRLAQGPWGKYIPGFNLIAVIVFELSCRNR